jgi:hypothetical protein
MAKQNNQGRKSKLDGKKIFLYTLGAGVIAGAGFLAYEHYKNKSESEGSVDSSQGAVIDNNSLMSESKADVKDNDSFPLKFGSRGQRVVQLQQRLEKILGSEKLLSLTPIDGIWGKGTEQALKLAGLPTVIYQSEFDSIISGGGISKMIDSAISKVANTFSGFGRNRDIITLSKTFVIDLYGNKIPVKKNVILGSELSVSNGMTRFRTIDGSACSVPTRDVRYI